MHFQPYFSALLTADVRSLTSLHYPMASELRGLLIGILTKAQRSALTKKLIGFSLDVRRRSKKKIKITYSTQLFKAEFSHSLVDQMLAVHGFLGRIRRFKKGQGDGHVILVGLGFMSC